MHPRIPAAAALASLLFGSTARGQTAPEAPPATVTAGFGRGVLIRSADRRFSLNIRGRIQGRFTLAERTADLQTEFQVRRMRVVLQGNALGETLTYNIQLAFSNLDTEPDLRLPLRDAYFTWAPLRDLNVRAGQMKVPFGRQRVISSSAQQFVDRSSAVAEFNLDRDVGVTLRSADLFGLGGRLSYALGVFGGDGRNRLSETSGLLWVARIQIAPLGDYDDLVEADVQRRSTPRLAIGTAVAFNQNTRRARSTFGDSFRQGFDTLHAAVDLQFKWRGVSLQAEGLYRRADVDFHEIGTAGATLREYSRSGFGYYVQAGWLFTQHMELSARWGEIYPSAGTDPALQRLRELGAGANWYFLRHDLKLQTDWFYTAGESLSDGRNQLRVQAQLYF
jgi:phosphate-selective porin OprO/OprP